MRIYAVLFVLCLPALVACGSAWAQSSAGIGKPVCTQFDDNASKTPVHATAAPATNSKSAIGSVVAAAAVATSPATAPTKGGATSVLHDRGAPHWQTLLPGMFR